MAMTATTRLFDLGRAARDYEWVERAIRIIDERGDEQPTLEDLSKDLGIPLHRLQKVFGRWVGISPKRFLQFVTKESARRLLREARSLIDVTYAVGLSNPSRLHDLFIATEATTPGEARRGGAGIEMRYAFHPSPFGDCLLGTTEVGISWLGFTVGGDRAAAFAAMEGAWPEASFREDRRRTAPLVERAFEGLSGATGGPLHLHVRGTNFQIKVWEALLRIPLGAVATYGDVAGAIGEPTAVRAVGNAVGRNPISFLIPCHRVIRGTGAFGNYGSGPLRKRAMLALESSIAAGRG